MKNQTKNKSYLTQKLFIALTAILISFQANAQEFDKWSLDLGGGIHQIGNTISSGYSENILGQGHLGVRYMFNEKFGLRLDLGYNQFSANQFSQPFTSNFYRASLQGVVNMGNVLKFNTWTKRLNLLAHGGIGIGIVNVTDPVVSGNEFTLPISIGLTPQFKISDRIAVFADFSSLVNFYQKVNFDGTTAANSRDTNISLFNTSIGFNISFGKYRKLADFHYEESAPVKIDNELDQIRKRLASAEKEIKELKMESTGPNKELIMTELDARYVKKEELKTNKYADVITGGNVDFIKELLNRGYINVYFDTNKSEIQKGSLNSVNYLKQFLMDNPTMSADIIGYADETGSVERNNTLSKKRAKKVYDTLIAAGISASRLSYFGGGVDPSVGEEARQFARKVVFKLR